MKKKLFSALASVVIVTGALVAFLVGGAKNEAHAEDTHVHCVCGETVPADVLAEGGHVCDKTVEWTPITTYAELKSKTNADKTAATDVYVYLANDINVTDGAYGMAKNVNLHLCLNGKKMISNRGTATTNAKYLIGLNTGFVADKFCSVTICDCSEEQTGELGHAEGEAASSLQGGTILAGPNSEVTIFGGTISGGSVISGKNGGNITMEQPTSATRASTFTMYGGTITGGQVLGAGNRGGNIYLSGVYGKMYGGTIENGTGAYGGNVCTGWVSSTYVGRLDMYGGTISGGSSTLMGGNIGGLNGGRFDMYGGLVTGGTVTVSANKMSIGAVEKVDGKDTYPTFTNDVSGTGGNIGMQGNSTIIINGGEVSNGTINVSGTGMGLGGNIGMIAYRNNATTQLAPTLNIKGGLIKNGSIIATTSNNKIMGGNVAVGGLLSTALDAKGTLNITGGTLTNDVESDGHNTTYGVIYNGTATTVYSRGGNIYAGAGTVTTITGTAQSPVEISNGYLKCANWSCGGNIALMGTTTVSGNVLIANGGGTTKVDGGNMYVSGSYTNKFTGVTFRDGWANAGGNFLMEGTSSNKTFTNVTFIGGVSNGDGGSIYKKGTGTLTLTGCNISGGYAKGTSNGGGNIYCGVGTVNATDCTISNGIAELKGGNLYPYADAIINLKDCTLTGGSAKTNTGGNAFVHGVLNVEGGEISYGVATGAGNIFVNIQNATNPNRGKFIATDVVIKNGMSRSKTNGALGVGSGHNILINGGDTYMSGYCQLNGGSCILEDLSGEGGLDYTKTTATGANIQNHGYLEINGTEVTGGYAADTTGKYPGGVIYVRPTGADVTDENKIAKFVMTDGVVAGGVSESTSGANLFIGANSVAEISGGVFKDARTKKNGGVNIYADAGSKLTISGGTFYAGTRESGDSSTRNIYINGEFHVSGGTFLQDKSDNNAIYVYKDAPATSTITGGYIERLFIYHLAADGKIASTVDGVTTYNPVVSGGFYNSINVGYVVDGMKRCNLSPAESLTIDGENHTFQYEVAPGYEITAGSWEVDKNDAKSETGIASVSGARVVKAGTTAELVAPEVDGMDFVGWAKASSNTATAYTLIDGATDRTYSFTPDADQFYVAIYKLGTTYIAYTITGEGAIVKIDGKVVDAIGEAPAGTEITLDYEGSDFNFWENVSNKVVSRASAYSFKLYTETELHANTANEAESTVVFLSASGQVIATKVGTVSELPAVPKRVGKTGGQWNKTVEEINDAINGGEAYVEVIAGGYTDDLTEYTVTVQGVQVSGTTYTELPDVTLTFTGKAASLIDIVAPAAPAGKTFLYFAMGNTEEASVLSYKEVVTISIADDMTVYAMYGDTAVTEKKPAIAITMNQASAQGDGKFTLTVAATRDLPAGYELVEQGILFAKSDAVEVVYGGTGVNKIVSTGTVDNGTTILNLRNAPSGATIYAKGYMIVKKAGSENTDIEVVYTDLAVCTAE